MRLTRLGWGCALMAGLTLLAAAATGNNLLYLLYSALLSALLLSLIVGKINLRRLVAEVSVPGQVFQGADFSLRLALRNAGALACYGVGASWAAGRSGERCIQRLAAGQAASLDLRWRFPHRGLNRIEGLSLESVFPFGLIRHRRAVVETVGLALPRLREIHSPAEIKADARASGRPTLRKGFGDELYGIREYDPSDDSRLINWKLSAKTGRPLVNEYCAAQDSKVTIRVEGGAGEETERKIEEAAAACRYYIDTGAEVRLQTPEEDIDYGKGLLQLDKMLEALARLGEGSSPRPAPPPATLAAAAPADSPALRRLTLAGGVLVYAAVFLIDEISIPALAALSPILPLGWWAQRRGRSFFPDSAWNLFSVAVLFYTVLVGWRFSGVTIANTHLLLYLLANRLLNPFKDEGLGQIFLIYFLAFFLASGLTISPWYFVFFLLYTCFSGLWMMLAAGASWERGFSWRSAWSGLFPAGLALAAVSFAATPRVEGLRRINPFLAAGIDKLASKSAPVTGFTEDVSLGFFGEMKKSAVRVMRVKPGLAPAGRRAPPLRIRGSSFDTFDGRRWSKGTIDFRYRFKGRRYWSADSRAWVQRRADQIFFPASPPAQPMAPLEFTIYPINLAVLFTAGTPWLIDGLEQAAYFDYTDSLRLAAPYMMGTRYRLHPNPGLEGFGESIAGYGDILSGRFMQLPPDPEGRVAELSRRVIGEAADAGAKAMAVESYLRRHYNYSMFSDARGRRLEDFLFKTRRGNCEYFATAGVILLRHAGVPARLVTGFLADDYNEYGKFYDVRQRQAHAWVEAYAEGRGWLTVDPTPPQGLFSTSADALWKRMERWVNAVQAEWYRHVIGYDQYVQSNTFRRLSFAFSPAALKAGSRAALAAMVAAAALWAAALLAPMLRSLWRARPAGFYALAEAELARAGIEREAHQTPREYARRVKSLRPDLWALEPMAELHYLQAYSRRGLSGEQVREAARLLSELRAKV